MYLDAARQLRAWTAAHAGEMTDMLAEIVNLDTSTLHRDGVDALAGLMATRLEALGFVVERFAPAPPPEEWVNEAFLDGRGAGAIAPGVLARLPGGSGQGAAPPHGPPRHGVPAG